MRRLILAALATVSLAATLGMPATAAGTDATDRPRVAIIVGPVGSLTPTYLHLAELAAAAAERGGADVARAYSPNATPANVLAAVAGANIVIYFGHGYGNPSPYGPLNTARQNGWGLQGPAAHGTHGDGLNGELAYYGEDWIVANARPAPGFVMIYSNTCYAPGASEGGFPPATPGDAAQRVAGYSRGVFALGGSAYYAVDFDRGAADLVGRILGNRGASYGTHFASDHRYVPSAVSIQAHPYSAGQQVWLHRTKYTDGPPNYWYAFAGNPEATAARSWDAVAPTASIVTPTTDVRTDASMTVEVSEPLVGLTADALRLVGPDGARVAGAVKHDPTAGTITFTPAGPLALSAGYRLQLAAGATDAAGNPLAEVGWSITTRVDADPLVRQLAVGLDAGTHDLVRFADDWTVAERRALTLAADESVAAVRRARLPGRGGSWLELRGAGVDGWWVAESPSAHAAGLVEDALFGAPATFAIEAGTHDLFRIGPERSVARDGSLQVRDVREVRVDRRAIVDGQLYLRFGPSTGGLAGRWIAAAEGPAPNAAEAGERRILGEERRDEPALLTLVADDWSLHRLDEAGRVLDRAVVPVGDVPELVTERTVRIGPMRAFVVSGGPYDGWVVGEDPRVVVTLNRSAAGAPD